MARKFKAALIKKRFKYHQKGAALILMVFLLSLVVLTYTVKSLNGNELRAKETTTTSQALADAKTALMSWSINHPNQPGLMPYPDRNADTGGYDGLSDCPGGATLYSHLIGRLPWKGGDYNDCNNLLVGLGKEFIDASNEPLWYAVSKNLVHIYSPSGDPVINPNIINNPPYADWMTVYDKNGQLISDRVAVIIFAPGPPISDQDRSSGVADATNYLDTFNLQAGGGAKSNRTYSSADEDFYVGEDSRSIRTDNVTYQHPYYFNDKLIYITIDELLTEIEKRAALEAKNALNKYQVNNGFFPYAAPLLLNQSYHCKNSQLKGALPIYTSANITSCSCSSGSNCSCPFNLISSVSFRRSGTSTWSSTTSGACSRSPNSQTCTCTGAGFCRNNSGTRNFTCTAAGNCTHNTTGTYTFNGVFTSATANTQSGNCSLSLCGNSPSPISASPPTATCTGNGSFSYTTCGDPAFTGLPSWFISNKWQDYFYYSISRSTPSLSSGTKSGINALLISTGTPFTVSPFFVESKGGAQAQNQPSCNVNDYLDSTENSNLDTVYDSTNQPKNSSYNDRVFIVAP
jgi:hypothetical protein